MRVHFGEFELNSAGRELTRAGEPIHLTPKAFRLLGVLIEQRPDVVTKEELYSRLWPGTFVEETNLSNLVSELRAALGDARRTPRFIRTVHGFGYAFIASIRDESLTSAFRLVCGKREFDLREGETVVGRDLDAAVRIDAPGISRHHARIIVSDGRAFIEDLGSKNGTFVRRQRVRGRVELRDGDEIRLGREAIGLSERSGVPSTLTQKPFIEP
ncbi:MAG TPA: FHA domain-containing protein [Thermoanaerobaculia bacterium]|nr:FHA domain-containing protein [Thermoanaerobaculia bacterium]